MKTKNMDIPLAVNEDSIDWDRIEIFKVRAKILFQNWDELPNKEFSGVIRGGRDGSLSGGLNIPNEFRLKGLYADFRHFYQNNSRTNLYKHANYLASLVNSDSYHKFIADAKASFLPQSKFVRYKHKGKTVATKELIETYFNAEFFHSDPEKIDKINEWQLLLSEESAKTGIFEGVMSSMYPIKRLYLSSLDLTSKNLFLNCPIQP